MRAIVCKSLGWPQPLNVADVPVPELLPGHLLVKVAAAGVNFADTLLIGGTYQEKLTPPFIPGAEIAGIVVGVAGDVVGFAVGDRVMGQVPSGGYAEFALLDARRAAAIPPSMPFEEAAGFYIPYGTACCGLVARGRLRKAETVLVTGAAGGVGLASVEIAAALGGKVLATARGSARQAEVRRAGACEVIDPSVEDLRARIRALTDDHGVDVVFDVVGGDITRQALRCLAFEGRLVLVGFAGGEAAALPSNHLLVKNVDVIGFYWGPYQTLRPVETADMFRHLSALYEEGKLRPRVAAAFPLERTGDALAELLTRRHAGKIIVETAS